MEIGAAVLLENSRTGETIKTNSAYLTFVGLDENKKPVPIPKIKPETDDEKRRYHDAELRVKNRLNFNKILKTKK